MSYHVPVMLKETIEALGIDPEGVYVDATFGGGGHSRVIVEQLKGGTLVAFDQDEDALDNVWEDDRLLFVDQNFRHMKRYLKTYDLLPVDGILADLGISSHQIDTPERGFSTRFDGDLDMRMDQQQELTAADVLNTYTRDDLQDVFSKYGEVRNSRTLADAVVVARDAKPFEEIADLKAIAEPLGRGNINRYLAQVFQALRIEVNHEMEVLEEFLADAAAVLKPGGKLVVLSYHSLEDRLVKNFMKAGTANGVLETDAIYGAGKSPYKVLTKKPVEATAEEIKINPRARSARMRVAVKR